MLTPGQACQVTVDFVPTTTGTHTGSLTVKDNRPGSPSQKIPVTGVGEVNAVSFSANPLNFPGTGPGFSSTSDVTLVNDGSVLVNISSITLAPSNGIFTQTNDCPASLAVGQTCTISVTFTPPDAGTYNATISVTDDSNPSPQVLPITGVGLNN